MLRRVVLLTRNEVTQKVITETCAIAVECFSRRNVVTYGSNARNGAREMIRRIEVKVFKNYQL